MTKSHKAGETLTKVAVIGKGVGVESLLCHDCRHDEHAIKIANSLNELCPLEINEKRTCARCHEQRGVWWFIKFK